MPQFQYVPFDPSGLVPSIASLIAHSADPYAQAATNIAAINAHSADAIAEAQARAREVSGDVWGRAIAHAGQIPNQVMAEQRANADAAQTRQLKAGELADIQERTKAREKAASDQQLLGSLLPQFTKPDPMTGMNEVDHEGLSTAFVQKGGDPAAMEKYLQGAANTREALEKITSAKRATATATAEAVGRQAKESSDAGDFLTRLDHLTVAGAIPPPVRDKFAQEVQAAGPDGWPAVQQRYVDWADSVAKPITVKADETVYKGVSGTPLMTGPASRKTEAELAADAANPQSPTAAQSKSALNLLEHTKNANKSLELKPGRVDGKFGAYFATADGRIVDPNGTDVTAKWQPPQDPQERLAAVQAAAVAAETRRQTFTEQQAGRKELTEKVEQPFRQAQQSIDELRNFVRLAQSGNKEAANLQALQATMTQVRSNGLNRLNAAEMRLPAEAGSLWDRVQSKIGQWTSGQPVDPSLQKDLLQLADYMERGAYNRYALSHKDIRTRYGLNEQPIAPPSGMYTVTAPNGKQYEFDSQDALDAFKKSAGIR